MIISDQKCDWAGRNIDEVFAEIRTVGGDRYAAFLADGYREWYSPGMRETPYLLQKVVRADTYLFRINIWVYDNRRYSLEKPVAYQPEAQFNALRDQPTFDVILHDGNRPPAEIEALFMRIYEASESLRLRY